MKNNSIPVHVSNCAKTYADGTQALQPCNLEIAAGEVIALLGPSGCGKTTLLRLLAGLETADAGSRILFDGVDVTRLPIEKREVGMVFQHYALFPQMSVEANIGYGLRIRGVPEAERRKAVGELIDLVRLNGLEGRKPAELSGGQKQRVAIARAVATRPRVLLLDEPLAALDAKLKIALREELAELLRRLKITAVHVTHDQQEAFAIADRLAVMHAGQIVQIGEGESLYRAPTHPFVASFLGRVNVVERSAADSAQQRIELGGQYYPCPAALQGHAALFVRPEDVQVLGAGASMASTDQTLQQPAGKATVTQRSFLGGRVQLSLEVKGQPRMVAEVERDHPANVGDEVGIWIALDKFLPGELALAA